MAMVDVKATFTVEAKAPHSQPPNRLLLADCSSTGRLPWNSQYIVLLHDYCFDCTSSDMS